MVLDRAVIEFTPGRFDREDVVITNPDDETMYIEVEVAEILRPGQPGEERVAIRNPRDVHVLATPSRLVLPPGASKLVRLVNLGGHDDVERVYRVHVRPIPPEMEAQRTGIKLLVAFDLLVLIAPDRPTRELAASRTGRELELENRGSANVLMRRGVQCRDDSQLDDPEEGDCIELDGRRLYAGNVWRLDLPYDTAVEFEVFADGVTRRERF